MSLRIGPHDTVSLTFPRHQTLGTTVHRSSLTAAVLHATRTPFDKAILSSFEVAWSQCSDFVPTPVDNDKLCTFPSHYFLPRRGRVARRDIVAHVPLADACSSTRQLSGLVVDEPDGLFDESRPTIPGVVVVEGEHDLVAVQRAVKAKVFVLGGGGRFRAQHKVVCELRRAAAQHGDVIIFTDPDRAGSEMRETLEDLVGPCMHAFISAINACGFKCQRGASLFNIGVEHAAPQHIYRALAQRRRSYARRHVFDADDLDTLQQLALMIDDAIPLCGALLGIGASCDLHRFIRHLNHYCYARADVRSVLHLLRSEYAC